MERRELLLIVYLLEVMIITFVTIVETSYSFNGREGLFFMIIPFSPLLNYLLCLYSMERVKARVVVSWKDEYTLRGFHVCEEGYL